MADFASQKATFHCQVAFNSQPLLSRAAQERGLLGPLKQHVDVGKLMPQVFFCQLLKVFVHLCGQLSDSAFKPFELLIDHKKAQHAYP
ncbi:hypothetical protein D3C75_1088980 [compost metagenome]